MGHVFLRALCPWAYFPELSNSQLIVSCTSRGSPPWFWQLFGILVQSLSRLFRGSSHKGWAKLPLLFLPSLRPKAYLFMSLGFLLPILNGPWLTNWTFPILEGSLVLDFNTYNILDLNINQSTWFASICIFIIQDELSQYSFPYSSWGSWGRVSEGWRQEV